MNALDFRVLGAAPALAVLGDQRAFVPVQDLLRKDPHLEMHTRGG